MSGSTLLASCNTCGYLLIGLPQSGICPECGAAYAPTDTIILVGRTRGRRAWMPREGAMPVIAMLVFGLLLVTVASKGFGGLRGGAPAFLLVWGTVGAAAFARQALIYIGSPSRVWLDWAGCRQSDADDLRVVFDIGRLIVFAIVGVGCLLWLVVRSVPHALRLPVLGAGTFLALVIAGLLYLSWRINRPKGSLGWFLESQSPSPSIPWEDLRAGRLDALPSGRHRIRLEAVRDVAGPFVRDAVNLEFDASPEQAAALRRQIELWRNGLFSAAAD
jgi:hypothetical protein